MFQRRASPRKGSGRTESPGEVGHEAATSLKSTPVEFFFFFFIAAPTVQCLSETNDLDTGPGPITSM